MVICTRNRNRALEPTLAALDRLLEDGSRELLIVDNASTDQTPSIARAFAARRPERIRVAVEPRLGLSAARNCGLRLAQGKLIVFLDDDAIPHPGWLDAYAAAFASSEVLAAGGPVDPDISGQLPDWLLPRYLPYLSAWDLGPEPVDLRYSELPRGANMAFRREAFDLVGGFDLRLGRIGRSLRSCEEIELGLRLERIGVRTVYVPGARVRHRVDAARLTPVWMAQRFAAQGFSEAVIDWKHGGRRALLAGWRRFRGVRDASRSASSGDPHRRRFEQAGYLGYCRGVLYAIVAVERWRPPSGGPAAPYTS